MWGTYVQAEVEKAGRKAKNDKEAERKTRGVLQTLLKEDEDEYRRNAHKDAEGNDVAPPMPPVNRKFRDPASVIRTD